MRFITLPSKFWDVSYEDVLRAWSLKRGQDWVGDLQLTLQSTSAASWSTITLLSKRGMGSSVAERNTLR
jgi:hypothetical protein